MKQNKYLIADYWRNKIRQEEELWDGLFDNQPISQNSLIINSVILNSYSNQSENAWAVYPNPQSVLGFLKFIYLPTAFIGIIKPEIEYQYYFDDDLLDLLEEFKDENPENIDLISKMEKLYFSLEESWDEEHHLCLEKLKRWTAGFNGDWLKINATAVSFHVFSSPEEAAKYIIQVYEEDLGIDFLENDLGITKNELLKISGEEIFKNAFMKRRFTDILTNRLKVAF
ncbi:hypothetical protein [Bacillus xiapuensis]|uniref:Uncharacterized protein n=1 Tax=Bacillus xiapuensis TaxID=2014075 RepID=A0ABU6NG32_9BACI|nr:hypothetical protein [Bacillus xiapuensis]